MIDLDDFKVYNDTCGHDAGDMVLETVVKVIRESSDSNDVLIRYGGDEFVLLSANADEQEFYRKLHHIRQKIHNAPVPGYSGIHLSVSIGGVYCENTLLDEAIHRADVLMYQAKNKKNAVIISEADSVADKESKQEILIVDDSEMNRAILGGNAGRFVYHSRGGQRRRGAASAGTAGTSISLVLLDIIMPVMDGFELLHHMAENHWIDDIPVIMISSEDSSSSVKKAYEMGVSDYISRPFDARVVYRRVFNTIKLYAKQRRLISMISEQVREKDKKQQHDGQHSQPDRRVPERRKRQPCHPHQAPCRTAAGSAGTERHKVRDHKCRSDADSAGGCAA